MNFFRRYANYSRREMRRWTEASQAMGEWIAWSQASDFRDLGELTAQWLEGTISSLPMYCGGPEDETKPLIPYLAAYNRAGFLTHASQPGKPLRDGSGQRAWVEGWCTEIVADLIENAALGTDLIVGRTEPGGDAWNRICVTIDDRRAFTFAGAMTRDYLVEQYRDTLPAAIPNLVNAWQVSVIDPRWGRNDLLWTTLADALAPGCIPAGTVKSGAAA